MECIPINHSVSCVRLFACLNDQGGLYAESQGLQRDYYGRFTETSGVNGFHSFPIAFPNKCLITTASLRLDVMYKESRDNNIRPVFAYSLNNSKFICGYDYDSQAGTSKLKPIEVIAVGY